MPEFMPLEEFKEQSRDRKLELFREWKSSDEFSLKTITKAWGFRNSSAYYKFLKSQDIYEEVTKNTRTRLGRRAAVDSEFSFRAVSKLNGKDVADLLNRVSSFISSESGQYHIELTIRPVVSKDDSHE